MSSKHIIYPEEIDYFIGSLRKCEVSEIGSTLWFDIHEILIKLNQQAIVDVTAYQEEIVKELLISNDKLPTIVHHAFSILVWRIKILPKLLEIDENPKTGFIFYTVLYHEAAAISLLEILLYHEAGCAALGDTVLDLIDYCAQAIAGLIGLVNIGHYADCTEGNILKTITDGADLERQQKDLLFKIGMRCLPIIGYISDKLNSLPVSAVRRMVQTHDVPCMLSEILHLRPWLKHGKCSIEKFIDEKWTPVKGSGIVKVTKCEAQTWFAFRQLLFNQSAMKKYELNEFRQRELTKCQGLLNDQILDQLPPLAELKHYLNTLVVSGNYVKNEPIILEILPEIKDTLLREARKIGFKQIVKQHALIFLNKTAEDIVGIAKRLNAMYNLDFLTDLEKACENEAKEDQQQNICGQCQKLGNKKCSQCKQVFYSGRECQVKHWPEHKNSCKKNN